MSRVLEAIAAGTGYLAYALKSPPRINPDLDVEEERTDVENTWDLPEGHDLKIALRKWFGEQAKKVLGSLPTIGDPLPDEIYQLADQDDMARAMTPMISARWDEGGRTTRERLGLDPDEWRVTDPHTREKIEKAALAFCDSTNATTNLALADALHRLRGEFLEGVIGQGEAHGKLADRVQTIFTGLSRHGAERIARTETSRAIHAASPSRPMRPNTVTTMLCGLLAAKFSSESRS